jgi:hypothetical protein
MRKLTTRFAIALLTFSVGMVIASYLTTRRPPQAKDVQPPTPAATEIKMAPDALEGWQKLDVEGKFSFYLPPDMTEVRPPNIPEADRVFRRGSTPEDEFLYLYYTYGRRASCDKDSDFSHKEISIKSEVVIGGKRAKLNIWQADPNEGTFSFSRLPEMTLCFPDVDRGTAKLYLYTGATDLKSLEVAKQIFNSIEFY